jgi:hypothetical protein
MPPSGGDIASAAWLGDGRSMHHDACRRTDAGIVQQWSSPSTLARARLSVLTAQHGPFAAREATAMADRRDRRRASTWRHEHRTGVYTPPRSLKPTMGPTLCSVRPVTRQCQRSPHRRTLFPLPSLCGCDTDVTHDIHSPSLQSSPRAQSHPPARLVNRLMHVRATCTHTPLWHDPQ